MSTLDNIWACRLLPGVSCGEYDVDTGDAYSGIVNDLIEAIAETCPGDPWYLLLCQKIVECSRKLEAAAKNAEDSEMYSYAMKKAEEESKKACICVYGQQKPNVVEAIIRKYSNNGIL